MTLLKILSLAGTVGVMIFTFHYTWHPGFKHRDFTMLATTFVWMGIPTALLAAMCLSTGKWAGFFLICALVLAWAIGSVLGYAYARWRNTCPFEPMFIGGLMAMILAGAPLSIYLIP